MWLIIILYDSNRIFIKGNWLKFWKYNCLMFVKERMVDGEIIIFVWGFISSKFIIGYLINSCWKF